MEHHAYLDKTIEIDQSILKAIISRLTKKNITKIIYQLEELQGGTLGDVSLISGLVTDHNGQEQPYKLVWKTQKQWLRPGDHESWRREYDLYRSDLGHYFTDAFRWPDCYHLAINDTEIQIWMEYIEGVSGKDLSCEMLEQASFELGCFQGRLWAQPESLGEISCLNDVGFMKREFAQWHNQTYSYDFLISEKCRMPEFIKQMLLNHDIDLYEGKSLEYSYLRSKGCDIAAHLKQMLMQTDEHRENIFDRFEQLPVVFCHRDFWIENIFSSSGQIRLIDWDTAGWGYLGEDIASLIIDEIEADDLNLYFAKLIPAYQQGLSKYSKSLQVDPAVIIDMILIKFGYRILQEYLFSQSTDVKRNQASLLQILYDLKQSYP